MKRLITMEQRTLEIRAILCAGVKAIEELGAVYDRTKDGERFCADALNCMKLQEECIKKVIDNFNTYAEVIPPYNTAGAGSCYRVTILFRHCIGHDVFKTEYEEFVKKTHAEAFYAEKCKQYGIDA